jgi:hypothetical protein
MTPEQLIYKNQKRNLNSHLIICKKKEHQADHGPSIKPNVYEVLEENIE